MKNLDRETVDLLVFDLHKPAQYIGGELNRIVKTEAALRMGLCYPDLYEVGMSNQGIKILYQVANGVPGVACERVFAVEADFERKARRMGVPLYTLESFIPLDELDALGFNLSYELLCTNVLQVLDLGRIPVLREERREGHPIVIAGGEGASNPAPMESFIDAFYIGDGEEGLVEILEALLLSKREGLPRPDALDRLGEIAGVYLPSQHRSVYGDGKLLRVEGPGVKKRVFRSHTSPDPERPLVPSIRVAQDRAVAELSRGCGNLCKFCHAGYYDLPCREHRPGELAERVLRIIENSGYSELTLSALSVSDYRFLPELLGLILPALTERGVSISLPSLRVDLETLPLIEQISDLRKTSLTFAVESASEDIRGRAGKNLRTADLIAILGRVFDRGWRLVKLYFMIGLPGCGEVDEAEATIQLLREVNALGRGKKEINVTLSAFVPKPHTPFQWERQMDAEYLEGVIHRIRRGVPRSVSIKHHSVKASILEGVLSRGDGRLGSVILQSYLDGCRLDSWMEHLRFDVWERNLESLLPGWRQFLLARGTDEEFPWSPVKTGFERLVAYKREKRSMPRVTARRARSPLDGAGLGRSLEIFSRKYVVAKRIRMRFAKTGPARFIPHIDFMEIIKRALRIARAPVSFTQGFNKRERISAGFPLPVGIESVCELCDCDLYEEANPVALAAAMNAALPEGIACAGARVMEERESLMTGTAAMEFSVHARDGSLMEAVCRGLEKKADLVKETKGGVKQVEFGRAVLRHAVDGDLLRLVLSAGEEASMRIDHVLLSLAGAVYDDFFKFSVVKTRQYRREGAELLELE